MPTFEYRIHPSVGIARMGNSPDMYFVGRETPEDTFVPVPLTIPGANAAKVPTGVDTVRDRDGKLAKQAARFRILCFEYADYFVYRDAHPLRVWEVTAADYDIVWKVKVANLKSWDGTGTHAGPNLPNQPDERTLTATTPPAVPAQPVAFQVAARDRLQLGSAFVESSGQLIVLGSDGTSRSIPSYLGPRLTTSTMRWPFWEDDAADGYVRARVTPKPGSTLADAANPAADATEAWVVINLPAYGFDTPPSPSLYDRALNHALANTPRASFGLPTFYSEPLTYFRNIRPFMRAYLHARFVSTLARKGITGRTQGHVGAHGTTPRPGVATVVKAMLRAPRSTHWGGSESYFDGENKGPTPHYGADDEGMPKLALLTYPELAYAWMTEWAATDSLPDGLPNALEPEPGNEKKRVMLLDIAHMGWMSGGSFYPGLEVGREANNYMHWLADWGTRKDHVDLRYGGSSILGGTRSAQPGELTRNLAVPWQTDFERCGLLYWPMSCPVSVKQAGPGHYSWLSDLNGLLKAEGTPDLNHVWSQLGFIRFDAASGEYHEKDRTISHPPPR